MSDTAAPKHIAAPDTFTCVVDELTYIYTPLGVVTWLQAKNKLLGGARPIDLLESGDGKRVLAVIESMNTGGL